MARTLPPGLSIPKPDPEVERRERRRQDAIEAYAGRLMTDGCPPQMAVMLARQMDEAGEMTRAIKRLEAMVTTQAEALADLRNRPTGIEQRLAAVEANMRSGSAAQHEARLTNLLDDCQLLAQQVEFLLACAKNAKPMVPFRERIPELSTITKLQAQLFVNVGPGKGRSEWVVKVYAWDTTKPAHMISHYRDGYYKPFTFPMRPASEVVKGKPTGNRSSLYTYAELAKDLDETSRVGCLTHKGPGVGVKGTKLVPDQVAVLSEDHALMLDLANDAVQLRAGVEPRESNDPKAPKRLWYWSP